MRSAKGWTCHHCKERVEAGQEHDCWTTTEAALTGDLSDDLREAWERIRETAVEFGDQRIYASGTAIMFSRKTCYFFVRPRKQSLQMWVFLGRSVRAPQVQRVEQSSRAKFAHLINIRHRDEVEAPVTDWMREAYGLQDVVATRAPKRPRRAARSKRRRQA